MICHDVMCLLAIAAIWSLWSMICTVYGMQHMFLVVTRTSTTVRVCIYSKSEVQGNSTNTQYDYV